MLYEAFEPEMDWGHFGVRVNQSEIPQLGDLLDGYDEEQLKLKQVGGQSAESVGLYWGTRRDRGVGQGHHSVRFYDLRGGRGPNWDLRGGWVMVTGCCLRTRCEFTAGYAQS